MIIVCLLLNWNGFLVLLPDAPLKLTKPVQLPPKPPITSPPPLFDIYEVVCDKPAAETAEPADSNSQSAANATKAGARTLPATMPMAKGLLNLRIPPPKPGDGQLTKLTRTQSGSYNYTPISADGDSKSSKTKIHSAPAISQGKVPLLPKGFDLKKPPAKTAPISAGRVGVPAPSTKAEDNNNTSHDGKIYEEMLLKPSQLKGQKNAVVRKAK